MIKDTDKRLIFDKSVSGRNGVYPGNVSMKADEIIDGQFLRAEPAELPEVSELDVIRHYTGYAHLNFSVDTHFYPLGSCTMKYNPKINEKLAALPEFTALHPFTGLEYEDQCQGALEVIYQTGEWLKEITGFTRFTGQPYAGAHGELTGLLMIAAYHKRKGNHKRFIIVPESAHGTNPASAAMAGFDVISIPIDPQGEIDFDVLRANMSDEVAGIMMTVPNTLGLFEKRIGEICELAHAHDALVYYDGANLNAIMGKFRPGDAGVDAAHLNLHKTFSAPHGGGGPGSGMVGVSERLADFLPTPIVEFDGEKYFLDDDRKDSIGSVSSLYGNFGVILKAYVYLLSLGRDGLIDVTEKAVLNANYILAELKSDYDSPYDKRCMHECVFIGKKGAIHALDIAKALLDKGIHPPTIYFPLVVNEALMIEPTETESKQTIDEFIRVMKEIAIKSIEDPESLTLAPEKMPVYRTDETKAARDLILTADTDS